MTGCCPAVHTAKPLLCASSTLSTIIGFAGMWFVAPSPFFNAQWRQLRNGSECIQLFAEIAPRHATVHAIISRADFSAEAKKLSLQYGSDLKQVLAQVKNAGW
jgi:hypothetical protein